MIKIKEEKKNSVASVDNHGVELTTREKLKTNNPTFGQKNRVVVDIVPRVAKQTRSIEEKIEKKIAEEKKV